MVFALGCAEVNVQGLLSIETKEQAPTVEPAGLIAIAPGKQIANDALELMNSALVPPLYVGMAKGALRTPMNAIDITKPSGAFAFCEPDQETPDLLICIPVSDMEKFRDAGDSLNFEFISDSQVNFEGRGTLNVKHQDGYLYMAEKSQLLETLPADTTVILNDLLQSKSIAVKVNAEKLPLTWKDQLWSHLKNVATETGDKNLIGSASQFQDYVSSIKEAVVRLDLDSTNEKLNIEVAVEGLEGSTLAKEALKDMNRKPSKFSGFGFPNASFNFNCCSDKLLASIENLGKMSDREQGNPEFDRLLNPIAELVDSALEDGHLDVGSTLAMKNKKPNFAIGVHVADGDVGSKTIDGILKLAEAEDLVVLRNVERRDNITFHQIQLNQSNMKQFTDMYGENSIVVLGQSDNELYMAIGEDAPNLLNICIRRSKDGEATPATKFQLRLLSIAKQSPIKFSPQLKNVYRKLGRKDRLTFESHSSGNGFTASIDVEVGFFSGALATINSLGESSKEAFETIQHRLND